MRLLALSALVWPFLVLMGCGSPQPQVEVKPEANARAETTLRMIERVPPADRRAMVDKAPALRKSLEDATDPDLKSRIAALGL